MIRAAVKCNCLIFNHKVCVVDARKHAQMSALARERDQLLHVIRTYEETFSAHKSLLDEIKQSCAEVNKKKSQVSLTSDAVPCHACF